MTHTLTLKHLFIYLSFGLVASPQSQPEMEYSLPELQAPRSNVADKPWPQVHSHTQRPHGENIHTTHKYCTWHFHHNLMWYIYVKGHFPHRLSQTYEPAENLCFAGVRGHGERGSSKAGGKGKHSIQHTDDATAEHDFLGCMSRWEQI